MLVFAIICGLVTDKIIREKWFDLSTEIVRKTMNTFGFLGPALGLTALAFTGCNQIMAVAWLCISVLLNGAIYSGFGVGISFAYYHYFRKTFALGQSCGTESELFWNCDWCH